MRADVHDRGTMKWVSLMLPEHVELLKEVFVEYKKKPVLDEQKMVEIDQTLKYAVQSGALVEMTYFYRGKYECITGKLAKIDQWRGFILLKHEEGQHISLSQIIDVQLVS